MIRYRIRNEYGLSDPELYAAPGEEDDPEALPEGVAMAGLVGVLRQLGDLAEFAAEIFHDLHEDVMATASRGHGVMLRLQQLEAEFPAVEKAIISQTDHSNYPHDEGVAWHPNIQCKQNMITQGDMPRFILDSYEECRCPPHLFTLDKFDVAGAGASLKRYSDPSFFKTEQSSNMIESDAIMEKKPRRIKKKAMRWRKGVTLEALLVANSESQSTSKDRGSRKVPPRTTKLKSRHPRSPDYKTISRICREHLQEVISSQQKIMSSCSARHYHVKFRSTDSSETPLPLGELSNFGALQPSGKLELSKVVPINKSDTVDATSEPINGSGYLESDDKEFLGKQHGLTELKEVSKKSTEEQNGMICDSEKLQDRPDLFVVENNPRLQSAREGKLTFAASHADQDADGCRSDDIASDDNFVDALNSVDTEGVINPEMKERDPNATVEGNELNHRSKEDENASEEKFVEVGPTTESSLGQIVSSDVEEPTCLDLPLINDSVPSTMATTNGPNSGSPSHRQLNGVDWTNYEEFFNDEDLMEVSSSSSVVSDNADLHTIDDSVGLVVSDNADLQTIDDSVDCQQFQDCAYKSLNAAIVHRFDEQSPKTSNGLNVLTISSNECADKKCRSVSHGQNSVLDGSSMSMNGPNDVLEDEEEINVGDANEIFLHPTKSNKEELQDSKKELEEGKSLDTGTSLGTIAALPDKDHVMCMNDLDIDNVEVPEENVVDPTPAVLDPDDIYEHLDGIALTHPNMRNNLLYESNDNEIVEDVDFLPDDDLSIPVNKHDTEDHQVVVLDEGACSARLDTSCLQSSSVESFAMVKDFAYVHEHPGGIQGESPSQDDREVYKGETVAPSSCLFNNDTEPSNTGSCEEHYELIEMEDTLECGKIVVTEESTTSRFADGLILPEEITDAAKYSDKAEVHATEEDCRHDVQFQSSSSFSEELETVEATCRNLGALDESREHISKQSVLQTNDIPFNEIETAGGKCSETDAVHLLSSAHFPEESDCEERLLEGASFNAEALSGFNNYDEDGAVSLKNNAVKKQPENVDQDLAWEVATLDSGSDMVKKQDADQDLPCDLSTQDSISTNPFMDPAYITNHAQIYSSPTMGYQPRFPEEEDFLQEFLIEHDNVGAASDSLWEPATPPDEAPLPSEVMTEEDFRSFYLEYHEINFKAGIGSCHGESTSDSNNTSNSFVVTKSDWDCYTSVQPVKLDQEASNGSKFSSQTQHSEYSSATDAHADTSMSFSMKKDLEDETPEVDSHVKSHDSLSEFGSQTQHAEYSSATDAHAETSMPFSIKKDREDETPEVDSLIKSHDSLSDNRRPEDMLSVPVSLQQEQHNLCGVDSHCSSVLFDKEKTNEESPSPSSNIIAVKEDLENHASLVPHSSANENISELDVPPSNAVPVELEAGAHVLDEHNKDVPFCISDEFDSPNDPLFSIDEDKNCLEASVLRTSFGTENDSKCFPAGEHGSQIALSTSQDETTVELEGHPVGNAIVLDQDPEVCVPLGLDVQIIPCSSADEKIHGHEHASLSSSVLVDLDSEDHVLGDRDFRGTPCSLVKDTVDESEAAEQNSVLSEEQEEDTHMSPVLDSQIGSCSFNIDKVGEIDGPPSCNVQVESEDSNYPTELDSQTAPCSSSSAVLADRTVLTPIMPSTDNGSYEDTQKPPPLPPLQWRLGRPRLGLLNTQGCMPESARSADPILQASNQDIDTGLGLLDQANRSLEPISSEGIKEDMEKSSMIIDGNDRNVEFRGVSPTVAETDIAGPFSEASENLKQQEHMSSSAIGVEEHLDDNTGVISKTGLEQHLDDNTAVVTKTGVGQHLDNSGITHETNLYSTNPLLPFPTYEPLDHHLHTLSSETKEKNEHPMHTHPAASEDDRSVNDHNVAVDMVSTSKGHIYESRCYQQAEHREPLSETLEHNGHISNAPQYNKSVSYQFITSEAPSGSTNRSAQDSLLEEENNQERQTLREQNSESSEDSPLEGSMPVAESMATQDCPNDRHNLEREKMNQPSRPGPVLDGLDEGSNVPAEQPPVMGWTAGPRMLHPNYGTSIEERLFQPTSTDNHLILKPISIRNIPRNPLVDAVAAHDRNSMRKVSELAPPTDKPNTNERNLLLDQIRNKTFNLKPASSMPIAIRSPARADTRNLKVAAIIEKANAIRQAVGSDDEEGDNWSD